MGLRYGLLAALTLVIASALVWDRTHPPTLRTFHRTAAARTEDVAVLVFGGEAPPVPPAPGPGPEHTPAVDPELLAPGPVPVLPPAETGTWVVRSGDTLGAIAQKTLGTTRRAVDIARLNDMDVDGVLRIGMELRLPSGATLPGRVSADVPASPSAGGRVPDPPEAPRRHVVREGDTLYGLAERYYGRGGRWTRIAEANGLNEGAALHIGTELLIP